MSSRYIYISKLLNCHKQQIAKAYILWRELTICAFCIKEIFLDRCCGADLATFPPAALGAQSVIMAIDSKDIMDMWLGIEEERSIQSYGTFYHRDLGVNKLITGRFVWSARCSILNFYILWICHIPKSLVFPLLPQLPSSTVPFYLIYFCFLPAHLISFPHSVWRWLQPTAIGFP